MWWETKSFVGLAEIRKPIKRPSGDAKQICGLES